MKTFIAFAVLALAAIASAASSAEIVPRAPVDVEFNGETVQVYSFDVTVRDNARASPRALSYHVTSEVTGFMNAYTFCKRMHWELATPKLSPDQTALEAVMSQFQIGGNAWLGAICRDSRWVWLSDNTFVSYHNFPTVGGVVTPVPACPDSTSSGLMIFGNSLDNIGKWFLWGGEQHVEKNLVVCEG